MPLNEEIKEDIMGIKAEAKAFIDQNVDYYQLLGLKVTSKAFGFILKIFLLALFLSIALLFVSFAGAFAIGAALDSHTLGFLIIGGVYFVISLLLYLFRQSLIDTPVVKKFSDIFYDN